VINEVAIREKLTGWQRLGLAEHRLELCLDTLRGKLSPVTIRQVIRVAQLLTRRDECRAVLRCPLLLKVRRSEASRGGSDSE